MPAPSRSTAKASTKSKTASGRRSLVAVHADRRESDLPAIPHETLDLWKGTGGTDPARGGAPGRAR